MNKSNLATLFLSIVLVLLLGSLGFFVQLRKKSIIRANEKLAIKIENRLKNAPQASIVKFNGKLLSVDSVLTQDGKVYIFFRDTRFKQKPLSQYSLAALLKLQVKTICYPDEECWPGLAKSILEKK